jgi:hypothetical protein
VRSFRELLQEALDALQAGSLDLGEHFRREAIAQVTRGPLGEDPVAQALALGRKALLALAQGAKDEARRFLSQAVRLHPGLGGGLALELLARLAEDTPEVGEVRALLERERKAWEEAPLGLLLLRALGAVPPEGWVGLLAPKEGASARDLPARRASKGRWREGGSRRASRERGPTRPTLRLPLWYWERERTFDERGKVLGFLPAFSRDKPKSGREGGWRSPESILRLDMGGYLTLRMDRLPKPWGGLLVLSGGLGSVLLPLPWKAPEPRLRARIPLPAEPGEEVEALFWAWEDLTPATLRALLTAPRVLYGRETLLPWLDEAVRRGVADPVEWAEILDAL